ncbi:glycosyltransferase [Gymnodinialimonas sp.]
MDPAVQRVATVQSAAHQAAGSRIASFDPGLAADRANLAGLGPSDPGELTALAEDMAEMAASDAKVIETVQPDVIVCDHRHIVGSARKMHAGKILHIANLIGIASIHRRATGKLPYPLDDAPLLVPGIAEIEALGGTEPSRPVHMCGPVQWQGWSRLKASRTPDLRKKDVCVFFGSTGNGSENLPLLEDRLSGHLSFSRVDLRDVDLATGLAHASCLLCHGGHGTVMAALGHGVPVIVFPTNPEQLEIGRRLQALNLGRLVIEPLDGITGPDLAALVHELRGDPRVKTALDWIKTALDREGDGAEHAAKIILRYASVDVA